VIGLLTQKKLPNGLGYLVKECEKQGIKFGIWIEPEMVNPKSELFEKHPDWVIGQPHRPLHLSRNQLILDLCNPKVQNYVFETIDNLLMKIQVFLISNGIAPLCHESRFLFSFTGITVTFMDRIYKRSV
jgi:alpha-galactosidase